MFYSSRIDLPEDQDVEAFVDFMRDEYIPAVEMRPTRVGQVEGVQLLQGMTPEANRKFLWLVEWNGMEHPAAHTDHVDDDVARKLEEFGTTRRPHVAWSKVSARSSGDPSAS